MSRTLRSHEIHVHGWLNASPLRPHADALFGFLHRSGYGHNTCLVYRSCIAHFAHWMTESDIQLSLLNETIVDQFLKAHLPRCHCGPLRQRSLYSVRAAVRALLRYLRSERLIDDRRPMDSVAITAELQAFSEYQERVCGFTAATRPGGHLKIPHPWAGQTPPPDGGGTRDDYAV